MNFKSFEDFCTYTEGFNDFFSPEMREAVFALLNTGLLSDKIIEQFLLCVNKNNFGYFSPSNVVLYDSSVITITLSYLEPESMYDRHVIPNVSDSYWAIFGTNSLRINYYSLVSECSKVKLDAKLLLKCGDFAELKKGDFISLPEFSESDVILLCVRSKIDEQEEQDTVLTKFNPKTLEPSYQNSSNFLHSRLQYCAEILGSINDPSCIKPLRWLCNYKAHFVRWSAAEALINIDFDKGIEELKRFRNDPHIHIRNASKQALEIIKTERDFTYGNNN